jgi:uncharacterized protein YqgV (UPF0045/DUF77 family)
MVECPVCHQIFASDFALQGHIRLKKDLVHMAFKQQQINMISQKVILPGSVSTEALGNNLLDALEGFVKNQEYIGEKKAKENLLFIKIQDMVEQERTIERKYHRLIDEHDAKLELERQKVREEVMRQYQHDVDTAVEKVRDGIMQNWQQAVNSAFEKGEKVGVWRGYSDAVLFIYCCFCGEEIFVKPGSDLHEFLIYLARMYWVGHPECRRAYGEQQGAFY